MTRVIVVGGGIAGVSAAAALSDHADVTLFEAEDALGYHASGRSAAMFEENYGNAVIQALNRASRAGHEAAGVLSPRGLLMVALPGEEVAFEKDRVSLGLTEIETTEAHGLIPILTPGITRAAYHREAMDIDTDRLLQSYARAIRGAGGRIVTSTPVTGIERGDTWQVTAGTETYVADVLVNAAGAWADQVATLAGAAPIGLTPYRRSMARVAASAGHDPHDWPMLFGPGEDWYAKPDAGALIVSPADEDPVEPQDAWADDMVLAEGIARYEARVTVPVTRVVANWAGLRTFAPDRALVIGEDPTTPGFFWCAGQGGYGFQTAPAAANLLAALVAGQPTALPVEVAQALSPGRFR